MGVVGQMDGVKNKATLERIEHITILEEYIEVSGCNTIKFDKC